MGQVVRVPSCFASYQTDDQWDGSDVGLRIHRSLPPQRFPPSLWISLTEKLGSSRTLSLQLTVVGANEQISVSDQYLSKYGDAHVKLRLRAISDGAVSYMGELLLRIEKYLEDERDERGIDSRLKVFVWSDPEDPKWSEICVKVEIAANSVNELEATQYQLDLIEERVCQIFGKIIKDREQDWILGNYFVTVRAL